MEIAMAKKSWDIEASIKYTEGDIDDIIAGAFEGGTNYWASVGPVFACGTPIREDKPESMPLSEWFFKMLLGGKGIVIMDSEDDSELGILTLAKVLKGIKMNHKYNTDKDTFDAEDYDRIIQFGLLGELVYG